MRIQNLQFAIALTTAFVPGVAAAQHAGHQAATPRHGGADMTQCLRVQPFVANIIAAAMTRVESARQSNSAAEMRAAIDDLDGALRDIRAQLAPCAAAATATDPHAGQANATAADPHAGHDTGGADKQMDPVCGLKVDPATSPKAAYESRTYSFCSEQNRAAFLKEPQKYVKKPKQ